MGSIKLFRHLKDARIVRRYAGIKPVWRTALLMLAAVTLALGTAAVVYGKRPAPAPVPFSGALEGDWCYFDAVGVSLPLYRRETNAGASSRRDTYYLAADRDGTLILAGLAMGAEGKLFSQQLYFTGGALGGKMPKPYRLKGIAVSMPAGGETGASLQKALGISAEDFAKAYPLCLDTQKTPHSASAANLMRAALFACLGAIAVLGVNWKTVSFTGASLRELKKHKQLGAAADILRKADTAAAGSRGVTGPGFVFLKHKGFALCPEFVKAAARRGSTVLLYTRFERTPVVLHFYNEEKAEAFMGFLPESCKPAANPEEAAPAEEAPATASTPAETAAGETAADTAAEEAAEEPGNAEKKD